jgi:hypothetical protein
MNAVDRVIEALAARGCQPRKSGKGWSARCPAHEDRSPSLSVSEGDRGAVLTCHKGCPAADVVRALGLVERDLFDDIGDEPRVLKPTPSRPDRTFPTWKAALAGAIREHGQPVTWHEYRRPDGVLVGGVARFATGDGGKTIRQASTPDAGKSWSPTAFPEPRPLLHLADVLQADRVIVVEGEKCADALRSLGYVATTSPGGSKAAGKADWSTLAGKSVVILPDHDEPGESYAHDVARLATAAGAADVRVVQLADHWPECSDGGDVADWIKSHGDTAEPADLREHLDAILERAVPATIADHDDDRLETWEPFPVDVLPEPLRSFVTETTEIMSADPALVALPLLTAMAGAVGNRRAIEVRPGWTEPAVLWAAVVAESGSMKSPCADKALAFVRERQQAAFEAHGFAMREWEIEKREYERASRRRDANPGDPPERPVAERMIVDDCTLEALGPILAGNPHGVLLARDELSGWVEGFDKYNGGRGGEVARWLSLYNAGPLTFDRKLSGTIHVARAAVSITGTIQPKVLSRVAGSRHVDNGLLPRFLLAMPPRRPKVWTTGDVNFATVAAMRGVFTTLAFARPMDDGGPKVLTMDAAATELFKRFYLDHADAQLVAEGAVAAMLSKAEAWAARLALILHVAREAGDDPTPGDRVAVSSIEAGITLARWFAREWRRVFAALETGGDVVDTGQDSAVAFLRARGGTATIRDLARLGPTALRGAGAAESAARRLVATGRAESLTLQTGGRPAEAIRLTG